MYVSIYMYTYMYTFIHIYSIRFPPARGPPSRDLCFGGLSITGGQQHMIPARAITWAELNA